MPSTSFLLASKVVTAETPPSVQTIQGVPTAIAAMVGLTERGPLVTPQFCTSFPQWAATFGGYKSFSKAAQAVQGFFQNGGTQLWFSRTCHFSNPLDASSALAVAGSLTLKDRGGAAAPAALTSVAGPFALRPVPGAANPVLEPKIDGGSANPLTLTAVGAAVTTGTGTFNLTNGWALVYKLKLPGSGSFSPLYTIPIKTADYVAIAAATAAELAAVVNKYGVGLEAKVSANTVVITTDKLGSGASLAIDASSTSGLLAALTLTAGTTNGSGNVGDIDAVTASELAALLTALPLTSGTAVATGATFTIKGVTTGSSGSVQLTTNTTALGIFAGDSSLPLTVHGSNSAQLNTIGVAGKTPGAYIADYDLIVSAASSGVAADFNLRIVSTIDGTGEVWPNLSMDPTAARYFEDFVNANSKLVTLTDLSDVTAAPNNAPANGTFNGWSGANDGLSGLTDADFAGNAAGGIGINAFDKIDNVTLLAIPDRPTSAVQNAMVTYCEVTRNKSCFAVLDSPANLFNDGQDVVTYFKSTAGLQELGEAAAFYWPQILILNPDTTIFGAAATLVQPPSGHLMGVYARGDASKPGGVYENPAGLLNDYGTIFGAVGLETDQVNDESVRDVVYPERINPICRVDGSPIHSDGDKTLKSTGDFPSIAERRGASFIETSCRKGTAFAKHRNNDRRLRQEVKATITAFLLLQYERGAFRGDTPNQGFYVDVSDALNPEESIFAGILNAAIGLATQKPAEFIVLTFTQDTRAIDAELAQIAGSTSTNSGA